MCMAKICKMMQKSTWKIPAFEFLFFDADWRESPFQE